MPKKQPRRAMGAISTTYHPGFKAKRNAESSRIYYLLPLSPLMNEAIATHQIPLRCPDTTALYVPGYSEEQQVYIISKAEVSMVLNSKLKDYKIFYQRTEEGPLYAYRDPASAEKAKDKKAKRALKNTRPQA